MKIGAGTVRFIASALPGFMTIQAHAQTLVPIPAPTDAALVFAGDQFRFWLALQAVTLALPLLALLLVKRTSIDVFERLLAPTEDKARAPNDLIDA